MKTRMVLLAALFLMICKSVSAFDNGSSDFKIGLRGGYTFIIADGYDLKLGMSGLMSADYFITEYIYAGTGLGFNYSNLVQKIGSYKYDSNGYGIEVPIYAGLKPLSFLKIDTGPTFSFAVAGNTKVYYDNEEIQKFRLSDTDSKRFAAGWRFSVGLFNFIYASANISLATGDLSSITVGLFF